MAKMRPGIYDAKIVNYGIGQTQAGDPQAMILFEYQDHDPEIPGGQRHEATWYGSFKSDKSSEITLKALLVCGFRGNDPSAMADGIASAALDVDKGVKITIEEEVNSQSGKSYCKVKWINEANRSLQNRLSRDQVKVKLGAVNLAGQLAFLRKELGVQDKANAQAQARAASRGATPTGLSGREPGSDEDFNFGAV